MPQSYFFSTWRKLIIIFLFSKIIIQSKILIEKSFLSGFSNALLENTFFLLCFYNHHFFLKSIYLVNQNEKFILTLPFFLLYLFVGTTFSIVFFYCFVLNVKIFLIEKIKKKKKFFLYFNLQ